MRDALNLPSVSIPTARLYYGYRSSAQFSGRQG